MMYHAQADVCKCCETVEGFYQTWRGATGFTTEAQEGASQFEDD